MSKYTAELRTIVENGFNIFDFEYKRTPESIALLSDADLQQGFIDHFYFCEVGFETLERFKQRLKTQWIESLGELDSLLVAYNNNNVEIFSNMKTKSKNKNVFLDTPKSAIDLDGTIDHATTINRDDNDNTGYAGITEIELLEIYKNKIKDIQTEFYESFDNLFMQIM